MLCVSTCSRVAAALVVSGASVASMAMALVVWSYIDIDIDIV